MSSIFLSHNHADKPFVNKLAKDLRMSGYYVWTDDAEIKIGDSLIQKIREGIEKVTYLGAVISSNSVDSEWVKKELDIAMNQEIEGKKVKVLPLLLGDVELPGFLKGKKYADFREERLYDNSLNEIKKRLDEFHSNDNQQIGTPNVMDAPESLKKTLPTYTKPSRIIKNKSIISLPADASTSGFEIENSLYSELAMGQINSGWYSNAEKTINKISDDKLISELYSELAKGQINSGWYSNAEKTIDKISDDKLKSELYSELAKGQINSGWYSDAEKTIDKISDDKLISELYSELVKGQINSGWHSDAEKTIDKISSKKIK